LKYLKQLHNTKGGKTRGEKIKRTERNKAEPGQLIGGDTNRHQDRRRLLLQKARINSKVENLDFNLTLEDMPEIPDTCPILGIELFRSYLLQYDNSPCVDLIDPTKGYIPGNVAIISWRANKLKSDATKEELRKIAEWVNKHRPA